MSNREIVKALIDEGWDYQSISDVLGISVFTIRSYRYSKKTGKHKIFMPKNFDEEWERAVYRLFGGTHENAKLDPG